RKPLSLRCRPAMTASSVTCLCTSAKLPAWKLCRYFTRALYASALVDAPLAGLFFLAVFFAVGALTAALAFFFTAPLPLPAPLVPSALAAVATVLRFGLFTFASPLAVFALAPSPLFAAAAP